MLDEKKIQEIKRNVEEAVRNGEIIKGEKGKFVEFFLSNSKNSFDTARLLFEVSSDDKFKKTLGFPEFSGFLWVINASYYSMFYMVRALLEKEGIKLKTDYSIHFAVYNALIYYFYLTKKLEKNLIEEFSNAEEEVSEVLGKEKAKGLIEDYFKEKEKRGKFTYEMGLVALQNKAKTSLERARIFNGELRKLLEEK